MPIRQLNGTMPAPEGGTIADGIYDLVEQHEYRQYSIADKYYRSALRFAASATQVEHIYDPELGSQADSDSPHRNMTVASEGPTLSFQVDCPNGARVVFPTYTRGYTASGDALWIFQRQFIEIYARRP